jgi:CheY-like chemotaxis protein
MQKILLVEDDNNLREIYQARLQAEGYVIVSAKDGEEALVVAKAEKPDLIISDVMMPKISGFEMLDILRNTPNLRNIKVIMLTALGQAEDQSRANHLGADRYLVKSQVTLEDIVKVSHSLLDETDQGSTDNSLTQNTSEQMPTDRYSTNATTGSSSTSPDHLDQSTDSDVTSQQGDGLTSDSNSSVTQVQPEPANYIDQSEIQSSEPTGKIPNSDNGSSEINPNPTATQANPGEGADESAKLENISQPPVSTTDLSEGTISIDQSGQMTQSQSIDQENDAVNQQINDFINKVGADSAPPITATATNQASVLPEQPQQTSTQPPNTNPVQPSEPSSADNQVIQNTSDQTVNDQTLNQAVNTLMDSSTTESEPEVQPVDTANGLADKDNFQPEPDTSGSFHAIAGRKIIQPPVHTEAKKSLKQLAEKEEPVHPGQQITPDSPADQATTESNSAVHFDPTDPNNIAI